ncbi:unnamed protein product, partial [Fusarium graminearum]
MARPPESRGILRSCSAAGFWLLAFGFWNVFLQNYATANLLLIPRWNSTTISSNGRERKKDRLRRRVDESRLRVRNGESRSNGT